MTLKSFPEFNELDAEIKQEFYEDVQSSIEDMNACVDLLEEGADTNVIDRMYRALHTVKGNCNMVFLEPFVEAAHRLEDFFSAIRSGDIAYDDRYGRFAIVTVNAINAKIDELMANGVVETDPLLAIEQVIDKVREEPLETRLVVLQKAMIAITDGHYNLDLVAVDSEQNGGFSFIDATDIEFFHYLLERGGTAREPEKLFVKVANELAQRLNLMLKNNVEAAQLEAAILLFALSFAWHGRSIDDAEPINVEQMFFVAGILNRMSGWQVAADLSLQVCEHFDGSGLPNSLSGDDILPAAQALSLSLSFARKVLQQFAAGYKSCLFTAVKALNAEKDLVYKSRLIERFNQVIKEQYLTEPQW